jgi:hypothetical protein
MVRLAALATSTASPHTIPTHTYTVTDGTRPRTLRSRSPPNPPLPPLHLLPGGSCRAQARVSHSLPLVRRLPAHTCHLRTTHDRAVEAPRTCGLTSSSQILTPTPSRRRIVQASVRQPRLRPAHTYHLRTTHDRAVEAPRTCGLTSSSQILTPTPSRRRIVQASVRQPRLRPAHTYHLRTTHDRAVEAPRTCGLTSSSQTLTPTPSRRQIARTSVRADTPLLRAASALPVLVDVLCVAG